MNETGAIMDNICRFCLFVSEEKMSVLSEQLGIMNYIALCVEINVTEKMFPQQVCSQCVREIDRISQFYEKVTKTQLILKQYLDVGVNKLENYYLTLKNKEIKEEIEISVDEKENKSCLNIKEENNTNKIENYSNCDETEDFDELDRDTTSNYNQQIIDEKVQNVFIQFKCLTCFDVFKSQCLLINHYNTEHKSIGNNSIKDVNESYKMILQDNKQIFTCSICYKEYYCKKAVVRHVLTIHRDERPFLCKLCGRTYKTVSDILRHSRVHDGTRLFCSRQCGFSTVYAGSLKEHERRHNKDDLKYKCECGKGFQVKTWYEQHQNVHTGLKPFVCDVCGMAFHMDRYLTAHRSTVHPQSSDVKRYVCVHCSLPCDTRNALTLHLKEHGISTNFLCDLCGKTLSDGRQLQAHKRVHLGVKPFACSICNKSFSKKCNLQLHERTHTGVKSHTCLTCGKAYSQKSTLQRHKLRHHSSKNEKFSK